MDLKTLTSAVLEIAEERGIPEEKIIAVIEEAIASAYKKGYGRKKQKIAAKLNAKNGALEFWQLKEVVSQDMLLSEEEIEKLKEQREVGEGTEEDGDKIRFNSERHILLEEAQKQDKNTKVGEELRIVLETKEDFGRIAAQTAKQVILQKIKEIEKEETYKEFRDKEGEVVSGIIQRIEPTAIFVDIGRTSGILPKSEQVSRDVYSAGNRFYLYIAEVSKNETGTPKVILSRKRPELVSAIFAEQVSEI